MKDKWHIHHKFIGGGLYYYLAILIKEKDIEIPWKLPGVNTIKYKL